MNFAIIGASGNVGRKTIEILEKSKIPFQELFLVASKKSAGKKIRFRKKEIAIENLENYDFSKAQISMLRQHVLGSPLKPDTQSPLILNLIIFMILKILLNF